MRHIVRHEPEPPRARAARTVDEVRAIVARCTTPGGLAPVSAVVRTLAARGMSARAAQGILDTLASTHLLVIRGRSVDPALEFPHNDTGRLWTHTRLLTDTERAERSERERERAHKAHAARKRARVAA